MKKISSQIVCQHLEKVSRSAIEKHQDIIRQFIRNRHGIYALYKKDRLIYVGLATDLRIRLSQHLHDRHAQCWNRFSVYLTIGGDKLKELETLTLRIANPSNNRQPGKFIRSEDLKKKFKKCIKQKQRQELNQIFYDETKVELQKENKKKEKGRTPILAGYINHSFKIKIDSNNKTYWGCVRKNGLIIVNKKKFTSPSLAAKFIVKYPVDGWYKWKYERSPGEWVFLHELRK